MFALETAVGAPQPVLTAFVSPERLGPMRMDLKPNEVIESERLILKRRSPDQADELYRLIDQNRTHLRTWMPWEESTVSQEDTDDFLKSCIDGWKTGETYDFSVFEKSSHQMIGSFGLHTIRPHKRTADLGFWIAKAFEGKGYIAECVRVGEDIARALNLHRLIITCDRANTRSAAVARRCGYLLEAIQIDESFDRGRYRDTLKFYKLLNAAVDGAVTENLPEGYSIREMESEAFWELLGDKITKVFDENDTTVRPADLMSEAERERLKETNKDFRWNYYLHLALMYDDRLAGWSWGLQDHRESFHMMNSAVLPEHRGRGLYARLLDEVMKRTLEKGFQRIVSRHKATNNAVLIPKLKRGFVLTGMETSDAFGTLMHLTYFANPVRKKILDFRVGQTRPDADVRRALKL